MDEEVGRCVFMLATNSDFSRTCCYELFARKGVSQAATRAMRLKLQLFFGVS